MKKETLRHAMMQTTTCLLMIIVLVFASIPQCLMLGMENLRRWKARALSKNA